MTQTHNFASTKIYTKPCFNDKFYSKRLTTVNSKVSIFFNCQLLCFPNVQIIYILSFICVTLKHEMYHDVPDTPTVVGENIK